MPETGQSVPISGTQQKLEMIEKEIDRLHEQKKENRGRNKAQLW